MDARGPVIEADPRWYETRPGPRQVHWRDPWLWRATDGGLHVMVTARVNPASRTGAA